VVFIEESIVNGVKTLLLGRVNELLGELEFDVPVIEFGGGFAVAGVCSPAIGLSGCERTEKERVIRVDGYSLSIGFAVTDGPDAERNCYAYAWAVGGALSEDPTVGGVAERAELTGKRYAPPKHPGTGEGWAAVLDLRIEIERR
jgi:hypothetical protein